MSSTVPMVHGHYFAAGSRAHRAAGRVALGCTGATARMEPQPMLGPWLPQQPHTAHPLKTTKQESIRPDLFGSVIYTKCDSVCKQK